MPPSLTLGLGGPPLILPSLLQVDFLPAAALSPKELERQRQLAEAAAKATR